MCLHGRACARLVGLFLWAYMSDGSQAWGGVEIDVDEHVVVLTPLVDPWSLKRFEPLEETEWVVLWGSDRWVRGLGGGR